MALMFTPLFASLVLALTPVLADAPSPGPTLRPAVAAAVAKLAEFKAIHSSHIGAAGAPSRVYAAFVEVQKLATPAEFHSLLHHPSPAVRGYVAKALVASGHFDQAELAQAAADPALVHTQEGCMGGQSSVGEVIYDAARWAPPENGAAHALATLLEKARKR